MERQGDACYPKCPKIEQKKSLMLSNERWREKWEMTIKKRKKPAYGRFWKP